MAKFKIQPDTRRLRKDGTAPIKIVLSQGDDRRYISLDIAIPPASWDAAREHVSPKEKQYRLFNLRIDKARADAEAALLMLPPYSSLNDAVDAVVDAVMPGCTKKTSVRGLLLDAARKFTALKTEKGTRLTYERTITHIERFRPAARLDDVNLTWLAEFDAHLSQTCPSANSRALHMRNVRAVFNFAIDEGLTQNYPFRRYKIKTVRTPKRSLSAEALRRLLTMEVEDWQRPYRDFFAISFMLLGANAKDLLYLTPSQVADGRIEFNRAKTKKLYSIKIEPEAAELLERYKGERHLLSVLDTRSDYLQYIRQCNHGLKLIGTRSRKGCKPEGEPLYPAITTYWARHSWATIAASLDIPKETIAAALGHGGHSVTDIYIDFDRSKIDDANRRVLDWVLYGKR